MLLIYNFGIRIYFILILFASLFNKKAKKWVEGRIKVYYAKTSQSVWFHFASLGEFEQGRPVLEQVRQRFPGKKIVVTFFSPSGYEVRNNTPLADYVYYLPLDTPARARKFIEAIDPQIAIFTKYEYWYHFFNQLHRRGTPIYMVSALFRPNQVFFKWYGGLHRRMLSWVKHFFVQDEASVQLLGGLGIKDNVTITGDTRFDRVWENACNPRELPLIKTFKNNQPLLVAGSSWPEDEALVAPLSRAYPGWKFIFAPHEIKEDKISNLIQSLPQGRVVRFSEIEGLKPDLAAFQILIIDNVGMLSALYQYADIAYIGGGFGVGIHNTQEAIAFGVPVIFGPNYQKFKEARDMVARQMGFAISNEAELQAIFKNLATDEGKRLDAGRRVKEYVKENIGATEKIMNIINIQA